MGKNLGGKTGFIIAVLAIFIYGIFFGSGLPRKGSLKTLLTNNIHLGLDLKGGTHLVMQVHVEEAVNAATDRDVQRLTDALAATGAKATKLDPAHPEVITITGGTTAQQSAINTVITGNDYASYDVSSTSGGTGYTMTMKPSAIRDIKDHTVETSIGTIRERIDSLGTYEPLIEPYGLGAYQIVLELPGVSNDAEVQRLIQATPKLAIHPVVGMDGYPDLAQATTAAGGTVPPDEEIFQGSSGMGGPDKFYVLKRGSVVEGTDFRDAQPSQDENGRPDMSFNLTTDAGDRFYKYTDANKNTLMAITLDNRVIEAANIESAIRDSGRITGGFTQDQVVALATKLRSGSLPASITPIETRTIGPSLGADSIHSGVVAAIAGMVVVMIFMLIYYRGAGINADLALVLNLVILLGFMAFSGATLSLPGIAGVILTIGMGVDSNVLIFERVREELRLGKTSAAAIQDGFKHAWTTIFDTHVTTVVSAGILFIFGTGPVKGFATTLTIGLLANVFTAVFVSRTIFDYLLSKKERGAALSI
jgi:preprotein translocase subunit SecD